MIILISVFLFFSVKRYIFLEVCAVTVEGDLFYRTVVR